MSNPTRIILVRHGETDWNAEARFQGQWNKEPEPSLTPNGHKQAESVAACCASQYGAAAQIYCSDLKRARQVRSSAVHMIKPVIALLILWLMCRVVNVTCNCTGCFVNVDSLARYHAQEVRNRFLRYFMFLLMFLAVSHGVISLATKTADPAVLYRPRACFCSMTCACEL